MDARLAQIIATPPVKTTSIGRTQWDPRTCTCGVGGATNREHDADCEVAPVLDENTVIQAIKERRMVGESLRRLTGADLVASERNQGLDADMQRQIDAITQAAAARRGRLAIAGAPPAGPPKPSDVPWTCTQVDGVWTITDSEAAG